MKDAPKIHLILLLILIALGLFRFFLVLQADRVPPIHDPLHLRHLSRLLYEGLRENHEAMALFCHQPSPADYPPLIHFTAQPFLFLLGPEKGAESSMALYLVILLLSIYGITRRLAGPPAGLLAVGLALLTPHLDAFSRVYMVDYLLSAMTALTFYLLITSEGFSRRLRVIILGVCCFMGMLAKESFVLYAAIPILCSAAYHLLHAKPPERARLLWNLALFILAAGIPLFIYYRPRLAFLIQSRLLIQAFATGVQPHPYQLLRYPTMLMQSSIGPVIGAGALVGLIYLMRKRAFGSILAWAVLPLFLIDAVHNIESPRYLLPVLPAFVMLCAVGVESLAGAFEHRAVLVRVFVLVVAAVTFVFNLFAVPNQPFTFRSFHDRFQDEGMPRAQSVAWRVDGPAKLIMLKGPQANVALLLNSPYSEVLQGALWDAKPLWMVDSVFEGASVGFTPEEFKTPAGAAQFFSRYTWLLLHSKHDRDQRFVNYTHPVDPAFVANVFEAFSAVQNQFTLIGRYPYPEGGGEVWLYERVKPPA